MFDFNNVELANDFEPVPAGWYNANIEKMEWKTSKAGSEYLNIQWKLDNNRVVFDILNLFHEKEIVRNIALGTVKKILMAAAAEKMDFASKDELVEALAVVNVDLKVAIEGDDKYGPKNVIKAFRTPESIPSSDMPF